jgi:hypothetical protein
VDQLKKKMIIDGTDPVIMTVEKKLELLERDKVSRSRMVDLLLHFPICCHGAMHN